MSDLVERVVVVNGEPCRVWEKGRGEPLFYLAGIAGLPRWTPFLDRLAATRRVIAPSLPGFPGATGHDRLDTALDWLAAALDLLEGAGLAGGDLVGASFGGTIAAEVAAVAPALVRRLVLIAPFGLYDKASPPLDIWAQRPGSLPALLCADARSYNDFTAAPEGAAPTEWSIVLTRASEAAARLLWPFADTRLERRLHRIRCATTILWGSEDKVLSPSYAKLFAAGIAGETRVSVIPGAGHLADLDAPAAVAQEVARAFS